MERAVALARPDYIFHLGDLAADAHALAKRFPQLPVLSVTGNCDFLDRSQEQRLLELLETQGLTYDGFHDCIAVRVRGLLPRDRDRMLRKLESAVGEYEGKEPVYAVVE